MSGGLLGGARGGRERQATSVPALHIHELVGPPEADQLVSDPPLEMPMAPRVGSRAVLGRVPGRGYRHPKVMFGVERSLLER